jgi:hypothetical protein
MHKNSMYNAPNFSSSSGSLSKPEGLCIVGLFIKSIRNTKSCLDEALSFAPLRASILVTDGANPILRSARSAMPQMTLSKAPVELLSIIMPGVFVNTKLSIVISLRMVALRQI